MANLPDYGCTNCGTPTERKLLLVKKVTFLEMGEGGRHQRSRVIGWLCPKCVANDTDWQRPAFQPPRPIQLEVLDANSA